MSAPALLSEGEAGLRRIAAAKGVLNVRLSERTANVLVEFDSSLIDESSLLSLVAGESTPTHLHRVWRPPTATDAAPEQGWLRGTRVETIDARTIECVTTILEFESYPAWQTHVRSVTVLERDERGRGIRVTIRGGIGERDIKFTVRYRYPRTNQIVFEQVDGELDDVRGSWTFRSAGSGRTRATYLLEVKPGWRLGIMARGALYGQMRDAVLDHVMSELRNRVEGTRRIRRRRPA